ncbi:MAG: sigma-70 family RNA polymerase sigma factor [Melioribacteraceae bacterium]|nr:sigma-70 family RNA polymerase sigma factor [Melioribacteraceae bacterium]
MNTLSEKTLVQKIRNKDSAAESEIYHYYYPKVKMIIGTRISDGDDQKDIINDIMVAIIVNLRDGKFNPGNESTLGKYVNGIIRNRLTQYFKDIYQKRNKISNNPDGNIENLPDNEKFVHNMESNEEEEIKTDILRKIIENLKPKYRKVIILRYFENKSVSEISNEMELTDQKVSDYLKYSKQLISKELKKIKHYRIRKIFFQILFLCSK